MTTLPAATKENGPRGSQTTTPVHAGRGVGDGIGRKVGRRTGRAGIGASPVRDAENLGKPRRSKSYHPTRAATNPQSEVGAVWAALPFLNPHPRNTHGRCRQKPRMDPTAQRFHFVSSTLFGQLAGQDGVDFRSFSSRLLFLVAFW